MKKILALVLGCILCMCALAGCTGNKRIVEAAPTADTLAGTYSIKVWVAEAAAQLTKQQIEQFNQTNGQGITINAVVEAVSESEAATNMTTDIEAGADLYTFTQDQAARLIRSGALAKLGEGAAQEVMQANDVGSVNAVRSGDNLWAYPLTADNGYFMYYDKAVISENDINSMEKLIAACERSGRNFSFELEGSAWYTVSFFFATGCRSVWDTDNNGAFISVEDTFDSPEGLAAAKGMKILMDSGVYNNSSAAEAFAAAIPSAVLVSGTWAYEDVKKILGDNMGVAQLPTFTIDGKQYHLGSFSGCKLLGVKPQDDAKRAAVLHSLAKYLSNEASQLERFNILSWGPANLRAQQAPAVKANPALLALAAQSAYSVPQGQIHGSWWDIGKALATNIRKATDEEGLKDALKAYSAAMDGVLTGADKQAGNFVEAENGSVAKTELITIC